MFSTAATQRVKQEFNAIHGSDVDKFVNIKVSYGRVSDLFRAQPQAIGVTLA